jgi:hypothetical protein
MSKKTIKNEIKPPVLPVMPREPMERIYLGIIETWVCQKILTAKMPNGSSFLYHWAYGDYSYLYLVEPKDKAFIEAEKKYKKDMIKYKKDMLKYEVDLQKWRIYDAEIKLEKLKSELKEKQKKEVK